MIPRIRGCSLTYQNKVSVVLCYTIETCMHLHQWCTLPMQKKITEKLIQWCLINFDAHQWVIWWTPKWFTFCKVTKKHIYEFHVSCACGTTLSHSRGMSLNFEERDNYKRAICSKGKHFFYSIKLFSIKLGLIKHFAKTLDRNGQCFKDFWMSFSNLSEE